MSGVVGEVQSDVIGKTRKILEIPDDYELLITPGSDTGAFESALWSMMGKLDADVLVWEAFSRGWAEDITNILGQDRTRILSAEYGMLPNLYDVNFQRDVVFPWNGTTSGVCIADSNWIPSDRAGLTFCDATSIRICNTNT